MTIVAHDPYGNQVMIPAHLIPGSLKGADLQATIDSPDRVIARPALMRTTCTGPVESCAGPCINHYFRLIGPDDTLLISAHKEAEAWVAFSCTHNPSTEQLAAIFQNTRPLL